MTLLVQGWGVRPAVALVPAWSCACAALSSVSVCLCGMAPVLQPPSGSVWLSEGGSAAHTCVCLSGNIMATVAVSHTQLRA